MQTTKGRALFLDRDGVVNDDTGYVHRPDQVVFIPGIFVLCRTAQQRGYVPVVVTNQSGVARGMYSERDVRALHRWMGERFREQGIEVAAFYYCPYHKDALVERYRRDSDCRKPRPGMLLRAMRELGVDPGRSIMVGDKPQDRIALPGLRSVVVKSRYSGDDYDVVSVEDVVALL